jgi:hypothetical protein
MPLDLNAAADRHNASDPRSGSWSPFYATIMPEGMPLWLNADVNAQALATALSGSGYVNFPSSVSASTRMEFWQGRAAVDGATVSPLAAAGITLRFSHGTELKIEADALFATPQVRLDLDNDTQYNNGMLSSPPISYRNIIWGD